MTTEGTGESLANLGIRNPGEVLRNLTPAELYEHSILLGCGVLAPEGPLLVDTGKHTGRPPNDKFTVKEPTSEGDIWWGEINRPFAPEDFERLRVKVASYLQNRHLYVFDGYAGADPKYRLKVRVVSESPWHCLFAQNMFVREPDPEKLEGFEPEFTVWNVPFFHADPETDAMRSEAFIVLNLAERSAAPSTPARSKNPSSR